MISPNLVSVGFKVYSDVLIMDNLSNEMRINRPVNFRAGIMQQNRSYIGKIKYNKKHQYLCYQDTSAFLFVFYSKCNLLIFSQLHWLFADTKLTKNITQYLVRRNFSSYFSQIIHTLPYILRNKITGKMVF